jgi:hypothetical protein
MKGDEINTMNRPLTDTEIKGALVNSANAEICHAAPTSGVTTKKTANGSALAYLKG